MKKTISVLILLLAVFFIFLFSFSWEKPPKNPPEILISLKEYLLSSFLSELPEINRNLPRKIDKNTTLLSIKYLDGKILSHYQLNPSHGIIQLTGIKKDQLIKDLKKQTCSQETKRKLLEVDIEFIEFYENFEENKLFDFIVRKTDCTAS